MSSREIPVQHIFIIGAKSIGQYGGYETFIDRLIEEHKNEPSIKYHVACKANGNGYMDESKLSGITDVVRSDNGKIIEFTYNNAHVFKLRCPNIGPGVAIYYDKAAVKYAIQYCKENNIKDSIFYILSYRIGFFIDSYVKQIHEIGGKYYLNPDGLEWKRRVWPAPVRKYWKWSEGKMVHSADLVICDSKNIEKYHKKEYGIHNSIYIAYGADLEQSLLADDNSGYSKWMKQYGLKAGDYYLVVARFVPENNLDIIIREFMMSSSRKKLVLVTRENKKYQEILNRYYSWKNDSRIRFVGSVYEKELLKKIRENAYGYIHGHEVGGTNPSLLEALSSTKLNLLLNVSFNREVGQDAALYWEKEVGGLGTLIDLVDKMSDSKRNWFGDAAKKRIIDAYSWKYIGELYKGLWLKNLKV